MPKRPPLKMLRVVDTAFVDHYAMIWGFGDVRFGTYCAVGEAGPKTTIHEVHEGSLDSAVLMSEEGFALAAAESYVDCIEGAQG